MKGKSRLWVTPKLIVLARSQAEECVLTNCKSVSTGLGPLTNHQDCQRTGPDGGNCGACQSRSGGVS